MCFRDGMADDENLFRFERLEIWQRAADICFELGVVGDQLAKQQLYKYAEQLRLMFIVDFKQHRRGVR